MTNVAMMRMNRPVFTVTNISTPNGMPSAHTQRYSGRRPILSVSLAQPKVAKMPIAAAMHSAPMVWDLVASSAPFR